MSDPGAFFRVAGAYCTLVETAHTLTEVDRVRQAAVVIADLYAAGLRLYRPAQVTSEPSDADVVVPDFGLPSTWPGLGASYYSETLEPLDVIDQSVGLGDLNDDILDIYKDVREGMVYFQHGCHQHATWHWWLMFHSHWGDHAVGAMRILHQMVGKNR
jgi:hypothetical protein